MVMLWAMGLSLCVTAADAEIAQVVQLNGQATVVHLHGTRDNFDAPAIVPLDLGAKLHQGDKVATLSHSLVRLLMNDGSVVDVELTRR